MSIQRNLLFNGILTVSGYIFPFIVFPYVARVLGPDNIGLVNYVDSIVNYAVLISAMGITIIGSRNVAKAKSDPRQLNRVFTALFVLSLAFTVLATGALVAVTLTVPALRPYKELLLVGLVKLWGNFLLIEWLFKGLEDFRYITIRSILVKLAYVVAVFLLVRVASDYTAYYLLICLMVAVNAAFNCARAVRLVKIEFDWSVVRATVGSFIILGLYLLCNSMYTTFNVTYLGWVCDDVQVGYYTTATKIFKIILAMYAAYTTVMLPRASALLSQRKTEEFRGLIGKSVDGLLLFSIPVIYYCMIYSEGIIDIIAGAEYHGAIVPMIIAMPLLFIIGYGQILVVQILTPMANDRTVLLNAVIGATVGIVGNLLIVRYLSSVGSALVWLCAEVTVTIAAQYFVRRSTSLRFPAVALMRNIAAYVPYGLVSLAVVRLSALPQWVNAIIGAALLVASVCLMQHFVLRNPIYLLVRDKLTRRKST